MAEPMTITELEARAIRIRADGYELRRWPNGTYLVEAPSGEATEVPEEALGGVLARLFEQFF